MANLFRDLTDVYEGMIDWPKRLAHEEPFYRRWFEQCGVRSVLDTACGTGHHAAMFHRWGLRVEGADVSESMIERAKASFGEPDGLTWSVRGFDQPVPCREPFDAVICVGNSLPLAPDMATVERAIGQMFAAIRPDGLLIIHVLNLWHLPDGPCVWQKCRRATFGGNDAIVIKGVHRHGSQGFVELLIAGPEGKLLQTDSTPLLGLTAEGLRSMASISGGSDTHPFGGYDKQPYDQGNSADIILTARNRPFWPARPPTP